MIKKLELSLLILMLSGTAYADLQNDAVTALINKNYITAIPLLESLAQQGNPDAQYNLALLYNKGLGVNVDSVKSRSYYSNAAHGGLVDSYRKLSRSSIRPAVFNSQLAPVVSSPQDWVKTQNPNHYTLQLASSTNADLIRKYFEENALTGKAGYYKNKREGEYWYALVYGAYPSAREANKAIASLPEDLRKWSPWVRKIKSIQRIMIK